MIKISDDDFSIDEVMLNTRRPSMGAVVMFLGTVRDMTKGNQVEKLEFEADYDLAVKELEQIRQEAIDQFEVTDVSIIHRTGELQPGENIVIIAVGAAHRNQAFKGCRYAIDELKKRAMIWKKEILKDRSYWVGDQSNE
ncbi:MAG: molybdenum cofactor biosynthesis protein MoaE [Candidatus Thorarchaeota archaeon]|nr:molybdenum cofactor biosynthesis protein MoaE [Candidatus Thorarchaeota archaeon]